MRKLQLVTTALAAALISSWTTVILVGRAEASPPGAHGAMPDFTELNTRLLELVAAMQARPEPVSTGPSGRGDPERTSLGESDALNAIANHLAEIKGLVGTQPWPRQQPSSQTAELVAVGAQHVDARWQALGNLHQQVEADQEAASRRLFFLSPAQVLQRFGRPTSIYTNDGGVMWQYSNGKSGAEEIDRTIVFEDGYVINVW